MVTARAKRILTADRVSAGYGGRPVVSDVSACVCQGEIVSIVGPNGAGKSTFLKALMGIIRISAGTVDVRGRAVTGMAPHELARLNVGYVPQVSDVFPDLTVAENLEMGGYLLPRPAMRERITSVVDQFPALKDKLKRQASKLSGGERKMVAIARALMTDPEILLLDEPTAGLAPQLAARLLEEEIVALSRRKVSVLLVEQRAAAALQISNWAYVLVSGHNVLEGAASELLAQEDFGEVFLGRVREART